MSLQRRGAKALEEHIADGGLNYPFPEDDPEYGGHLASAWLDGYDAGVSTRPSADIWVPVPLRWRHVVPGDSFVAPDGQLWHVTHSFVRDARAAATAVHGDETYNGHVDPDDTINVLVPVTERDAVELCREELGARLTAGRTA